MQRFGRKGRPIYHIVVADARAPRDGRYIARLGSYNPNTNPATIDLSVDDTVQWIRNGVQPTDTCRAILSYKGVMMKKHLQDGVVKGAFSQEEAENRFGAWLQSKEERIEAKKSRLKAAGDERRKARMAAESKINQERAAALIAKKSALAAELEAVARAAASEAAVGEHELAVDETSVDAPVDETTAVAGHAATEEDSDTEPSPVDFAPEVNETTAEAPSDDVTHIVSDETPSAGEPASDDATGELTTEEQA